MKKTGHMSFRIGERTLAYVPIQILSTSEMEKAPCDPEHGLPNAVAIDDMETLHAWAVDDGAPLTWGAVTGGDHDICLRYLEVARELLSGPVFGAMPETARVDVWVDRSVEDAIRAFLVLERRKLHAADRGRLLNWIEGASEYELHGRVMPERDFRLLETHASDLGFWDREKNPTARPPGPVPGHAYSICGTAQPSEHGAITPPELSRFFDSFEHAALTWIAMGRPRQSGSSVWLTECEGVDTVRTVTIG